MAKLQYVGWDFDDANDAMQEHGLPCYTAEADVTVADYVRFIYDFDSRLRKAAHIGAMKILGL